MRRSPAAGSRADGHQRPARAADPRRCAVRRRRRLPAGRARVAARNGSATSCGARSTQRLRMAARVARARVEARRIDARKADDRCDVNDGQVDAVMRAAGVRIDDPRPHASAGRPWLHGRRPARRLVLHRLECGRRGAAGAAVSCAWSASGLDPPRGGILALRPTGRRTIRPSGSARGIERLAGLGYLHRRPAASMPPAAPRCGGPARRRGRSAGAAPSTTGRRRPA